MLALHLNCSTATLTTPKKELSNCKLLKLKMLNLSDWVRTGICFTFYALCTVPGVRKILMQTIKKFYSI